MRLAAFASDQRGAISIIAAAGSMMVIAFAALAVDLGAVYLQSRKLQGVADLAALAAARDLANAQAAAQATANANGWTGGALVAVAQAGRYEANPKVAAASRFQAGAASANAVRVTLTGDTPLFFGQAVLGKPSTRIVRTATAARAEMAGFSIGTRLASLQGGVANALLSGLTGSTVSLSVMDYNGLASADVELFRYLEALRTRAGLQTLNYNEVLAADLAAPTVIDAVADVLLADGRPSLATAVRKIAAASTGLPNPKMSRLIELGPIGYQDRHLQVGSSSVSVSAMDMASAILQLANGGRQVALDLDAALPGVADATALLAIGERPASSPWLSVGGKDAGVTVRTAQMRLYVEAEALGVLGLLGSKPVRVPLLVEAAAGEARIADISCPSTAASQSVKLQVRPSIGKIAIADVDASKLRTFTSDLALSPAKVVDLNILGLTARVNANAEVKLGGETWKDLTFNRADIDGRVIKSASTTDTAQSVATSLVERVELTANVAGLGLNLGAVTSAVGSTLNLLAPSLDGVVNSLTGLLGVKVGEADLRVHGLRCRDAALVA